jgi:hypothetical protein
MTPKMRGALEALRKMQHHADAEADKLVRRIETQTMPALEQGFKSAHTNVDAMHGVVQDIEAFAEELKSSNGGDPLDDSGKSAVVTPLRSSEVASR